MPPKQEQNQNLTQLQQEWTELYRKTLPQVAKEEHGSSSGSASKWPVHLDHCFARIILDNTIGVEKNKPWTEMIKSPATKNMSEAQLRSAIDLGQKIWSGEVDLWELDKKSLEVRGKKVKATPKGKDGASGSKASAGVKRKHSGDESKPEAGDEEAKRPKEESDDENGGEDEDEDTHTNTNSKSDTKPSHPAKDPNSPQPSQKPTRKAQMAKLWSTFSPSANHDTQSQSQSQSQSPNSKKQKKPTSEETTALQEKEQLALDRARMQIRTDTSLKPFRAHVLTLLTQVPKGRYTTYQALSDAAMRISISTTLGSSNTQKQKQTQMDPETRDSKEEKSARGCARAIGSAMRNNPFAPTVPCHRVLASDGKIGGFKGEWGEDGGFAKEKFRLLREEGVKFDGRGRVVGEVFRGFS